MRRTILALVTVALACAATAAGASTTTLRLTEKQTFEHNVDRGAKGESSGDIRDFGGPLYRHGKRVGHDRIHCVVDVGCTAVMWLKGGTLHSKAFQANGPRFSVGIRSGTGAYKGAKGRVDVNASGQSTRYVVRLVR